MIIFNPKHLNTFNIKRGIIVFALVCCLLLIPGCSNDNAWEEPTEETEATEKAAADSIADETEQWKEIKLTDNYAYRLPEYSEEITDFEPTDGFVDEKRFLLNNGDIEVRSFVIVDEMDIFPGLVEEIYEGVENANIGYRSFFDTAAAAADDVVYDTDGEKIYRRAYFWPDGGNVLCSLSVISYSADDAKAAGEDLLKAVRYAGVDGAGYQVGDVPPNANELLTPSQEEINQAMMQDIQESMQEYEYDEGYVDYDSSLGKRGR